MLLWDIIRDFFVRYVFGGITSNGDSFVCYIGSVSSYVNNEWDEVYFGAANDLLYGVSQDGCRVQYLGLSDWLSTTATIITLVALFIGISCLMVSLFRWIVRLVSLRG